MALGTGNLDLKGSPSLNNGTSIAGEVIGTDFTGDARLTTMVSNADFIGGGEPTLPAGMRDFAGKTQSWGRQYADQVGTFGNNPACESLETSKFYSLGTDQTSELLAWTNDRQEATFMSDNGTEYVPGDTVSAFFYRRTKQTSGGWTLEQSWIDNYASQTWSTRTDLYDYYWNMNFCLMEGERIYVTPNTTEAVENIKVGDYVYTAHQDTGEFGLYKVRMNHPEEVKFIVEAKFDDGSSVWCTPAHKFMTTDGVKSLGEIKEGESVRKFVNWGEETTVKLVSQLGYDKETTIYKMEVDEAHTYITENGIYQHNEK